MARISVEVLGASPPEGEIQVIEVPTDETVVIEVVHSGPPGESAYEIAVSEGFEGTEEEWLDSLVGPPGADGNESGPINTAAFGVADFEGGSFTHVATDFGNIPRGAFVGRMVADVEAGEVWIITASGPCTPVTLPLGAVVSAAFGGELGVAATSNGVTINHIEEMATNTQVTSLIDATNADITDLADHVAEMTLPPIYGVQATPATYVACGDGREYMTDDVGPLDTDGYQFFARAAVFSGDPDRVDDELVSFLELLTKYADDVFSENGGDQDGFEAALELWQGRIGGFLEMVLEGMDIPVEMGEWAEGRWQSYDTAPTWGVPLGGWVELFFSVEYDVNIDGDSCARLRFHYRVDGRGDHDAQTRGWAANPNEARFWKRIGEIIQPGPIQLFDEPTKWRIGCNFGERGVERIELYKGIASPSLFLHFDASDSVDDDGVVESSQVPGMFWEPKNDLNRPVHRFAFPEDSDDSPFVDNGLQWQYNEPKPLSIEQQPLRISTAANDYHQLVHDVTNDGPDLSGHAGVSLSTNKTKRLVVGDDKAEAWDPDANELQQIATRLWVASEIADLVVLGETSDTAYRGDRGKDAYDHSQITSGNPHGTTASDVGADPSGSAAAAAATAIATAASDATSKANAAQSTAISTASSDATTKANAAQAAAISAAATDATTKANAKVADVITDGVTNVAPSQNAVFDQLATKGHVGITGQLLASGVYTPLMSGSPATVSTITDRLYLGGNVLDLSEATTFDRFAVYHESGLATTGTIRLGLWSPTATGGGIGALYLDLGDTTVNATTGAGAFKFVSGTFNLPAGRYIPGVVVQGMTGTAPVFTAISNLFRYAYGNGTNAPNQQPLQTGVTGSLPNPAVPNVSSNTIPVFYARKA